MHCFTHKQKYSKASYDKLYRNVSIRPCAFFLISLGRFSYFIVLPSPLPVDLNSPTEWVGLQSPAGVRKRVQAVCVFTLREASLQNLFLLFSFQRVTDRFAQQESRELCWTEGRHNGAIVHFRCSHFNGGAATWGLREQEGARMSTPVPCRYPNVNQGHQIGLKGVILFSLQPRGYRTANSVSDEQSNRCLQQHLLFILRIRLLCWNCAVSRCNGWPVGSCNNIAAMCRTLWNIRFRGSFNCHSTTQRHATKTKS